MTVRLSDWDGQNSSLAFLIRLIVTIMVTMMMMPVSLPQHGPGLCAGHRSPLPSPLSLPDDNTEIQGCAKREERGKGRG